MTQLNTCYTGFPVDGEKFTRKKTKIKPEDTESLKQIISDSVCGILTTGGEGCMATRTEGEGGMNIDYIVRI